MPIRILCLVIIAGLMAACSKTPVSYAAPLNNVAIKRSAYIDGRLWLLDEQGTLFSLTETDDAARTEALSDRILDVCQHDGSLWALTGSPPESQVTLHRRLSGAWQAIRTVESGKDNLGGLSCSPDSILAIGSNHAVELLADESTSVTFKKGLWPAVAYRLKDQLYIGEDKGEWGGGLHRVDLRDGSVTTLGEVKDTPCEGLLNPHCEVITGIVEMPGQPDCLAVASGLMHLSGSGRLYRVCHDDVRILYEKRYRRSDHPDPDAYDTIPFLNLFRQGDVLFASGSDGVYVVSADGAAQQKSVTGFRNIRPFKVSFAVPGIVVVRTDWFKRYDVAEEDYQLNLVTAK
jgi:hypothetical protein